MPTRYEGIIEWRWKVERVSYNHVRLADRFDVESAAHARSCAP